MSSLTGDAASEDVNDFLARIRELGDKRDREDEERTRKLEEDIMKGRQERAARRAERARSISPTKDSPASFISSTTASQSNLGTPTSSKPDMSPSKQPFETPASSPMAFEPSKPAPPPQSSLSRSGTLSWQQRPLSRGSTTIRSRPLSIVAAKNNAMRSPSATPEPSTHEEKEAKSTNGSGMDREPSSAANVLSSSSKGSPGHQIAALFVNKDPSSSKQEADRGQGSAAYRRSEEPPESNQLSQGENVRSQGVSRESTAEPEHEMGTQGSMSRRPKSYHSSTTPGLTSLRLDPPKESPDDDLSRSASLLSSPGRMSPERAGRPASPTKGMGGFVQSAMLKRNDSVNKRSSAQPGSGLSRGNSIASNRSSRDLGPGTFVPPVVSHSRGEVPATRSGESEAIDRKTSDGRESPLRDKDGFIKPALPEGTSSSAAAKSPLPETNTSRPGSPTKDTRRWSPMKSSWLENAINKPESPKPLKTSSSQQPAWLAELQKAKAARASVDLGERPPLTERPDAGPATSKAVPTSTLRGDRLTGVSKAESETVPSPTSAFKNQSVDEPARAISVGAGSQTVSSASHPAPEQSPASKQTSKDPLLASKVKPETPPKKDFRSNLKARPTDSGKGTEDVPEFKKAFGNLKRAETKNYVAPDKLKENISRGKAALVFTGGPQQTKRVDEFKESILAKKKDFVATQTTPLIRNPSQTAEKPVPEALAKRNGLLNRAKSSSEAPQAKEELASPKVGTKSSTFPIDNPLERPAATPPLQAKSGGLAAKFNPSLAGLLAKGPSPMAVSGPKPPERWNSQATSTLPDVPEQKGPELTHVTKGRARGPKRKPPKLAQAESQAPSTISPAGNGTAKKDMQDWQDTKSIEDKMMSYNNIKSSLIGAAKPINALGIVGNKKAEKTPALPVSSQSASTAEASVRRALITDKAKPPAPKSSSARLPSGTMSPKTASRSTDVQKAEPLSPIASTSKKVNLLEKPSVPPKNSQLESESIVTPSKRAPTTKVTSTISPKTQRLSSGGKLDVQPRSPMFTEPQPPPQTPMTPTRSPRSPPVPAKSAAARSISTSLSSPRPAVPPQGADSRAKQIIQDFFGTIPPPPMSRPDIDTQFIVNANSIAQGKIKTLRKQIWELTSDGKRHPVPAQQEHILFENCMYICTHVFGTSTGKHTTEVYFWVGDGISPSAAEDAQTFVRSAAREAGAAGGRPILLHQGKESGNFFEALGGIVITRRGSTRDAGATYMLCGRKHMGQMAFDEVDFSAKSLCSGFPFIVAATGGSLFLWKGKGSGADELGCARLIAMDLGLTGEIEEIDEGAEPEGFWNALRSRERSILHKLQQHWHLKAAKEAYGTRLFAIDNARPRSSGLDTIGAIWGRRPSSTPSDEPGTAEIHELSPYAQSDLAQDGVLVLDAYFEVYVILGWRSSARFPAFRSALLFAQEYSIIAASQEDRPFVPPAHVVFAGADAPYMKSSFRKWDDKMVTTKPVGSAGETTMVLVHEALAAVSE